MTIGVDVGGTFVKLGLVEGARIRRQEMLVTRSFRTRRAFLTALVKRIESLKGHAGTRIHGVGVGIPGLVRTPEGVVQTCANLPGWRDVPLRSFLSHKLGLSVWVDNDVNCMTVAEWKLGAGRGTRNLVCITLGTGVGGGIILDGRLIRGAFGGAGEIGHMPASCEGPRCPCGGRGCLERFVGNREVIRWVRKQLAEGARSTIPSLVAGDLSDVTPEIIDQACRLGDPLARKAWARAGSQIGLVLAGVANLLNPERIVVGGGIAKAGRWILSPMRQAFKERAMREWKGTNIVPARLGGSAGLIGAALLAREEREKGERRDTRE